MEPALAMLDDTSKPTGGALDCREPAARLTSSPIVSTEVAADAFTVRLVPEVTLTSFIVTELTPDRLNVVAELIVALVARAVPIVNARLELMEVVVLVALNVAPGSIVRSPLALAASDVPDMAALLSRRSGVAPESELFTDLMLVAPATMLPPTTATTGCMVPPLFRESDMVRLTAGKTLALLEAARAFA